MNKKSLIILTVLLVSTLVLAGCGEDLVPVTVNIEDAETGEAVEANVRVTNDEFDESFEDVSEFEADVDAGTYNLTVEAEGYETKELEIVLTGDPVVKTISLTPEEEEVVEEEEVEEEIEEEEEEVEEFDLNFNTLDINQNPLQTEVELKKDGEVIASQMGSEFVFYDLEAGTYELTITPPDSYEKLTEEIDVTDNLDLDLEIQGGPIEQIFLDETTDMDILEIENLEPGDKILVGAAYLRDQYQPEFDLDSEHGRLAKIEYDVRQRGIDLMKEHGSDFADLAAPDYEIGEQKEFKVNSDIKDSSVNATLEAKGENIYIFVDENKSVDLEVLDELVAEFDSIIYPMTGDSDDPVTVLLTPFKPYQVTGYFDAADLYPELGNEERILYLNSAREMNTILAAASRQQQHLSFYRTKAEAGRNASDAWIDEGLAQVVQMFSGYVDYEKTGWTDEGGSGWIYDEQYGFLSNADEVNLLTHDGSLAFSGASSLFSAYLFEQYEGDIIDQITTSSDDPIKAIEDYTERDFINIYLNWVTTNLTDRLEKVEGSSYNYASFELQKDPVISKEEISAKGIQYFEFEAEGDTLEIKLPTDLAGKLGISVIKK